jgi:hypothetical protein
MQSLNNDSVRNPASTDLSEQTSIGISDELYDTIFPYYTMQCAVGQVKELSGETSGKYGHGLIYIGGACKDKSADYPKVKLCEEGSSSKGVIVSLDGGYINTLFATVDGKDLLFNAGLQKDQVLDKAFFEQTVQKAISSGAARGVKINPAFIDKSVVMGDEERSARQSTKTDWAVSFARDSACARIPMNKAQVSAMVDALNQKNSDYISGNASFHWDEFTNNCITLIHNSLAQAGIVKTMSLKQPSAFEKLKKAISEQLPIPGMDLVKTVETVNNLSNIGSAQKVFANKDLRDAFEKFEALPLGGSVEWIPMHVTNNTLYQHGEFKFDPIGDRAKNKFMNLLNDPQYSTVEGNLNRTLDHLKEIQKARVSLAADDLSDLAKFSAKYNAWIDQSILDYQSHLDMIKAAKSSASLQADSI